MSFRRFIKYFLPLLFILIFFQAAAIGAINPPERILSLAPAATEIIFDLGLGDKVVGVTEYCTWPPEALSKTDVGDMMRVNMESVISMAPDLVLLSNMNEHLRRQIEILGFPTVVVYQDDFARICDSMLKVGEACGIADRAKERVEELRRSVLEISERARLGRGEGPKTRVLVVVGRDVGDDSFKRIYVAGPRSFYNDLLNEAGTANAFEEDLPYASISLEGLLRLDPDLIIELVGEHGMTGVDSRSILDQWKNLSDLRAAREGDVAVIRGDFTLRAGPRYPLILESFGKTIHEGVREIVE
ncbi:MAG: helical backbone metal receptor [Synergistaceae bacterium]|nr:helical backbone metal receptor [Synergistaceae bacterium]